jgi:hypothetical protein
MGGRAKKKKKKKKKLSSSNLINEGNEISTEFTSVVESDSGVATGTETFTQHHQHYKSNQNEAYNKFVLSQSDMEDIHHPETESCNEAEATTDSLKYVSERDDDAHNIWKKKKKKKSKQAKKVDSSTQDTSTTGYNTLASQEEDILNYGDSPPHI